MEGGIDNELAAFFERGNSIVVAARNTALKPSATRACGMCVLSRDRIAVLVPRATSAKVIPNLQDNGAIAICVSSPRDFRTVQLKGRAIAIEDSSAQDLVRAEEQLRDFGDAIAGLGYSRKHARNLWLFDNWRVTVLVTAAYEQTPGPGAGAPMEPRSDRA